MAINFPNNPNLNDVIYINNVKYLWNGSSWTSSISSSSVIDVWTGSQEDYDDIPEKSQTTLYFIENQLDQRVVRTYLGDQQIYAGVVPTPRGEAVYQTAGSYLWTAPDNVYSVSVEMIGGGGGGHARYTCASSGGQGAKAYKNNISVIPGNNYVVVVGSGGTSNLVNTSCSFAGSGQTGGTSYFINTQTLSAGGGGAGGNSGRSGDPSVNGAGGTWIGDDGVNGVTGGGNQSLFGSVSLSGGAAGFGVASSSGVSGANGVRGVVRIIWGAGRAFPSTDV